jgi:hypothetical protein
MDRLGGYDPPATGDTTHEGDAPDPAAKPAKLDPKAKTKAQKAEAAKPPAQPEKPEKPAPAVKPDEPAPTTATDGDLRTLETLASGLGLKLDGGALVSRERAEFRARRQAEQAKLDADARAFNDRFGQIRQRFEHDLNDASSVVSAIESGDADALAAALGHKDLDGLQEYWINKVSDPGFARTQELERKLRERDEAEERHRSHLAAQSENNRRVEAQRQYMATLTDQAQKSADPLIQALADEPLFLTAVRREQQRAWDGSRTISFAQAATKARAQLTGLAKMLSEAFADDAPAARAATNKPGVKPRPRSAVVPPHATPTPSKPGKMSKPDFYKYASTRLREAIAEDRRSE